MAGWDEIAGDKRLAVGMPDTVSWRTSNAARAYGSSPSGTQGSMTPSRGGRRTGPGTKELMDFILGFAVWLAVGLAGAFVIRSAYRTEGTLTALTIAFGVFGAFIGGMLGTSGYIFHNPVPLRLGGILGATAGAFVFSFLYHFIARRAV